MVIVALDCETYEKYDGKEVTKNHIISNSTEETRNLIDKEGIIEGYYYPVLDATKFALGCIIMDKRQTPIWFYKSDDMFNFLLDLVEKNQKHGHCVFCYAHNHFFDLACYGYQHLNETDIIDMKLQRPLLAMFGKDKVIEKINPDGTKRTFTTKTGYLLDTYSFYKTKLSEVGKLLGIPKKEMPSKVKSLEELKEYLQTDTKIVYEAIRNLISTIEQLGHHPKKILTAGNLVMKYFMTWCKNQRHRGIPYSSYLYKRGTIHQSNHHDFIRKALRGARVERFQKGAFDNLTMIDTRSLYPFVMSNMPMPDLLKEQRIKDPELIYSQDDILNKIGVAEATVKFPKTKLSYLPVRYKKGNFFPQDTEVRGTWTLYELKKAKAEGYEIIKLHDCVMYDELDFNPFKEFINELYGLRLTSKPTMAYVMKLLMNSLAGKFSQFKSAKIRQICERKDVREWEDKGFTIETDYGTKYCMVKELEKQVPKYAHPIITIYVNMLGRDFLYDNLKKIPFEDLLYCDTDSIAFKGNHLSKFKIGNGLGDWKVEYENVKGEFVKEKIYRIIDPANEEVLKNVFAGNTKKELSKEQLWGEEKIINKRMYSLNMAFRTGKFDKVGTTFDVGIIVNSDYGKRDIKFPPYYREFTEDEMKCAND